MKPLYLLLILLVLSCKSENKLEKNLSGYETEIETYFQQINEKRVYYLELIGLLKINEGNNTFGKTNDNSIAINTNIIEEIGIINKTDSIFKLSIKNGFEVKDETNNIITETILRLDEHGSSKRFYYNNFSWSVITRSGTHYLRIWDTSNPLVKSFKGFETFSLNEKYIVNASFKYYTSEKNEEIETKLGVNTTTQFIGKATFILNNEEYTLDVGENGFTMVSDLTSGNETYGGGRYIYFDLPNKNGDFKIDFNRLYNPPCAFSSYTTCPLPPRQNRLSLKIEAGELQKKKLNNNIYYWFSNLKLIGIL